MDQRQTKDEKLGLQVAAGEANSTAAFYALYEEYAELSLAFIAGRVPAHVAPDIHQELWLKAWDRAATFTGGSYKSWLLSIAKNRVIDFYRARARKKEQGAEELAGHADQQSACPLSDIIDQEMKMVLQQCIETLDDRSAAVVRQRLFGESYKKICDALKITENAAHKIVFHAKTQLKDCVQAKTS